MTDLPSCNGKQMSKQVLRVPPDSPFMWRKRRKRKSTQSDFLTGCTAFAIVLLPGTPATWNLHGQFIRKMCNPVSRCLSPSRFSHPDFSKTLNPAPARSWNSRFPLLFLIRIPNIAPKISQIPYPAKPIVDLLHVYLCWSVEHSTSVAWWHLFIISG